MNKRQKVLTRWVIIIVSIAVVASLAFALPWNGNDDEGNKVPTPTAGPGLEGSAAELATLLSGARKHTFHAKYAVKGDSSVIGGKLTLEWWNKGDDSRVDTVRTTKDQVAHTASFVNGDEGANCQQIDAGKWTCKAITVPAEGDPGGIISTLTSQLAGRPVAERAGTVNGRKARCFHVGAGTGGTDQIDICVDADGILLRNASSTVSYEVTSLDKNVPDAVFKTPVAVK